ncbi:hypothetical protein MtrunA17_Chr5g0401151 [Medicago truncatula]|nr:hypothetical protein MtrunA17_Chr5g0401151 [Medicago truncatula]
MICSGLRCSTKLWLLRFHGSGKTRSLSQFQLFSEFDSFEFGFGIKQFLSLK